MEKVLKGNGLISGDKPLIAKNLSVKEQTVGDVINGRRVTRQTMIQVKVAQAAEFCAQKNREKEEFIKRLAASNTIVPVSDTLVSNENAQ
jgi:hypothetical protein